MYASVQLTKTIFPWIVRFAVIGRHEFKLAWCRMNQRKVVFKHALIQTFPVDRT